MTSKISYDNLIFEVTRRCNMSCKHCLRGDAQNIDMPKELVDKVLENADSISHITFTGGEPTLNLPLMQYILSEIKRRQIPLYGFFIATNGLEINNEFLIFCIDINTYIIECNNGYDYDEGWMSSVALSQDPFHSKIPDENIYKLKSLSTYSDIKNWKSNKSNQNIIARGRAEENAVTLGYKIHQRDIDKTVYLDTNGENIIVENEITVTSTGYVYADCDYEYNWDGKHSIGNLNETPMYQILLNAAENNPFENN